MAARTGDKRIYAQLKHTEGGTRGHSGPVDPGDSAVEKVQGTLALILSPESHHLLLISI